MRPGRAPSTERIGVANAPCSWGVIENVAGDTVGYRRVLDEMVETGYAGTELGDWGFMPTDPRDAAGGARCPRAGDGRVLRDAQAAGRAHHERSADEAGPDRTAAGVGRRLGPLVIVGSDPYGDPVRSTVAGRVRRARDDRRGWSAFIDGIHLVAAGCATRPASARSSTSTSARSSSRWTRCAACSTRRTRASSACASTPATGRSGRRRPCGRGPRARRPRLARPLQGLRHRVMDRSRREGGTASRPPGMASSASSARASISPASCAPCGDRLSGLDRRRAGHPAGYGRPARAAAIAST